MLHGWGAICDNFSNSDFIPIASPSRFMDRLASKEMSLKFDYSAKKERKEPL